ncbi:hypothetical protein ABKV19_020393 [Rosa sericea]
MSLDLHSTCLSILSVLESSISSSDSGLFLVLFHMTQRLCRYMRVRTGKDASSAVIIQSSRSNIDELEWDLRAREASTMDYLLSACELPSLIHGSS